MRYSIIDLESDGLLYAEGDAPEATCIHCMCVTVMDTDEPVSASYVFTDYSLMAAFLQSEDSGVLIGHNLIRYDKPMLEKFLGIRITKKCYDTLAFSWYLYPNRARDDHNLASWGEDLGIQKPVIDDWTAGNIENIIDRCREDVKITNLLFHKQLDYLKRIYEGMSILPVMDYLSFKMDCAAEQEALRWKVDRPLAENNLIFLEAEESKKKDALIAVLPPVVVYKMAKQPMNMYKKDGSLSMAGERWQGYLSQEGVIQRTNKKGELMLKIPDGVTPGEPTNAQLKKWLFSLGWEPITFKYVKEEQEGGSYIERPIPQISLPDGSGLCPSVKDLIEFHPEVEQLDGLFTVTSRKNNVKSILKYITEDDHVTASILGFTNTLRFQHGSPLVNLPGVAKRYGEYVRSVLIAPDNHVLCGSDMKSLEDSTKRHYMWPYDPEYVKEQMAPDYDAHLTIGVLAGMITEEEMEFYKWYEAQPHDYPFTPEQKARKKQIGERRKASKQVNFASVYGASPKKIHLTSRMPMDLATKLHAIYWKKNWAVKKIAEDMYYKTVDGQLWLYNPVSGFFYSLRYIKDIFSTLNQGTGVFCFDTQVKHLRKRGLRICGQFHDEIIAPVPIGNEDATEALCNEAISETNKQLKLNIELGISVQFGSRYSDIH